MDHEILTSRDQQIRSCAYLEIFGTNVRSWKSKLKSVAGDTACIFARSI